MKDKQVIMSKLVLTQNQDLYTFIHTIFKDNDGWLELRPISDRGRGIDYKARRWYQSPQSMLANVNAIIDYCRRKRNGVFIGLLPRDERGTGTGEHVGFGRVVWSDVDSKDFTGGKMEAMKGIEKLKPRPHCVVESGGGFHVYYFLDEPTSPDEIESANKRLSSLIGGDHCHDRARVLRLPTSYHCKAEPYRLEFLWLEQSTVMIQHLLECWPSTSDDDPVLDYSVELTNNNVEMTPTIQSLLVSNSQLRDLWNGLGKIQGDQSGSGYDYAFAREALYLGATIDDVAAAIRHRCESRGKNKPESYIETTIGKANAALDRWRGSAHTSEPGGDQVTPWMKTLKRHPEKHPKAGSVTKSRLNLSIIMENDDKYSENIRMNVFKQRIEFNGVPIKTSDTTEMALDLARRYHVEFSTDMIEAIVVWLANRNEYHPVQDYLLALPKPTTTSILDDWLVEAFGVDDNELNRAIGRKWAISAVGRILSAGCFVKHTLVLSGPQNIGKSSAIKLLAKNPDWYRDTPFNIRGNENRDAYTKIRGAWLYELPEMKSIIGVDSDSVKAFLSSTVDTYRRVYERFDVDVPRQCVFIATTNKTQILDDPTGAVRFWPITVEHVDFNWLMANVDSFWAEAVAAFHAGERWDLTTEQQKALFDSQKHYEIEDARMEAINMWLVANFESIDENGVTALDLMTDALDLAIKECSRRAQREITDLLIQHGWYDLGRRRVDGIRARRWLPPMRGEQ
jgi:predicted P-loop ATPase